MIFSSLSKREKIILLITVLIIGVSILWGIILEPFVRKWVELDDLIFAKNVKLQKSLRLLDKYESNKAEYKKYSSLIKGKESDERHMAAILTEIDQLARRTSVYVTVLKPNAIKNTDFYQKFIVEVELDTSIAELAKFFYQLEKSPEILKVEDMEITARSDQKGTIRCRLLISKILFQE